MAQVVAWLHQDIDLGADWSRLAAEACLSPFHFHRTFHALLGETPAEMVRRLRLERAAQQLLESDLAVTQIAFDAGYSSLEAFIRAFRAAFGYAPSAFRESRPSQGRLPTPNGVHFGRLGPIRFRPYEGELRMTVSIQEQSARRLVCLAHQGPYPMIGRTFGEIVRWAQESDAPVGASIALYYDDPCEVAPEALRSDAAYEVPGNFEPNDPRLTVKELPAGTYAIGTYIGPYEGLPKAWDDFMSSALTDEYEMAEGGCYEEYIDDCNVVPVDQLRTLIGVRVRKRA